MGDADAVRLSEDERNEFLGRGGTGVISVAAGAGESPYSVPVSYGYDAEISGRKEVTSES